MSFNSKAHLAQLGLYALVNSYSLADNHPSAILYIGAAFFKR